METFQEIYKIILRDDELVYSNSSQENEEIVRDVIREDQKESEDVLAIKRVISSVLQETKEAWVVIVSSTIMDSGDREMLQNDVVGICFHEEVIKVVN